MFKAIIQSLDIQCRNAKAVVVKTIRTPLFILKNLFTDQKNSKVLHLVRDPRPTIMSQNFAIQRIESVSNYAGTFCARILHDITTSDILTTYNYPGRIIRIHYENRAYYPINMTMQIYKYLNLAFSNNVEKSVLNMTSSGKKNLLFWVQGKEILQKCCINGGILLTWNLCYTWTGNVLQCMKDSDMFLCTINLYCETCQYHYFSTGTGNLNSVMKCADHKTWETTYA